MGTSKTETNSRQKLNNELESLLSWLSLNRMEQKLRKSVFQELKLIIETTLCNCKIESIGSYYSGMFQITIGVYI